MAHWELVDALGSEDVERLACRCLAGSRHAHVYAPYAGAGGGGRVGLAQRFRGHRELERGAQLALRGRAVLLAHPEETLADLRECVAQERNGADQSLKCFRKESKATLAAHIYTLASPIARLPSQGILLF